MALLSSFLLLVVGLSGYVAGQEDLAGRLAVMAKAYLSGPGGDVPRGPGAAHVVIGPIPPAGEVLFSRSGKGPRADQLPAVEGFERVMLAEEAPREAGGARLATYGNPWSGELPAQDQAARVAGGHIDQAAIVDPEGAGGAHAEAVGCLARLIYHEARGEPLDAQIAVAQTVMNRVRSAHYPADVCGVVFQGADKGEAGCQFLSSCRPTTVAAIDARLAALAREVAEDVLSGRARIDGLAQATHYQSVDASAPWALAMTRLAQVGSLVFYRADFVPREHGAHGGSSGVGDVGGD